MFGNMSFPGNPPNRHLCGLPREQPRSSNLMFCFTLRSQYSCFSQCPHRTARALTFGAGRLSDPEFPALTPGRGPWREGGREEPGLAHSISPQRG